MKCHEVKDLSGFYLDSELDAKTSFDIRQHLESCPACARWFVAEEQLNAQLAAALRRGQRTPELWDKVERQVATEFVEKGRQPEAAPVEQSLRWISRWRALLWPSPRFHAGVAVVWLLMLAVRMVNLDASTVAATSPSAPATEMRAALAAQRRELAELLSLMETPNEDRKTESHRPRSELKTGRAAA
jgi:anti-sigma factor RsiW